jgi:hypothetical protein
VLACFVYVGCASPRPSNSWTALADALVERMALTPGERVLLVGVPGPFDSLVNPLRRAIVAAGGVDLGAMDARSEPFGVDVTTFVGDAAGLERAELVDYFQDVDLAVML